MILRSTDTCHHSRQGILSLGPKLSFGLLHGPFVKVSNGLKLAFSMYHIFSFCSISHFSVLQFPACSFFLSMNNRNHACKMSVLTILYVFLEVLIATTSAQSLSSILAGQAQLSDFASVLEKLPSLNNAINVGNVTGITFPI